MGLDEFNVGMYDFQTEEARLRARQVKFGGWSGQRSSAGEMIPQPIPLELTGNMANTTTHLTDPEPAPLHASNSLEPVRSPVTDKDKDVDQLDVRSREDDDELSK